MILEEFRYLPWSGRRYKVSQYGKLLDNLGNEIETTESQGHIVVEIDWVLGRRQYQLAFLIIVVFQGMHLPDHLWDQVLPLYADGDFRNLNPVNLTYKFRKRLEVENYPGYFYIPFFTDYGLTENGDIINVATSKHKVWSVTHGGGVKNQTGGYLYNRVVSDSGISKTLFLHRALAFVFLEYGNNVHELVINHRDGQPSNNKVDNLEWSTYKENNKHAYAMELRKNSASPVLMRNLKTGEITRYESIQACGRSLGLERADYIRMRLINGPSKVYEDLLQFKYDDGTPWSDVSSDPNDIVRLGRPNTIAARNIFTGEIVIFQGTPEGARLTGVKAATILRHVRETALIPVGGYNFRYLDCVTTWPEFSSKCLRIFQKYPIYPPDGMDVKNLQTGEEIFYESVAEACNALKISKTIAYKAAQTGRTVNNKYQLKLFEIRKNLGHPTE
jgi:hypothetical protein